MSGLVSILDQTHHALVKEIWFELETECELQGINATPLPHFSWQIAEDYEWDALDIALKEITDATQPFKVQTSGLGLFTAENPAVYIPIVRTKELSKLHEMIWDRLAPISTDTSPFYSPPFWMPHITLAYGDVDAEKLHCLLDKLAFRPVYLEIEINNLTLIQDVEGTLEQTQYLFNCVKKNSC